MLCRRIQALLLALAITSGIWQIAFPANPQSTEPASWPLIAFLVGVPVLLAALLGFHVRWAPMVVVMYGTIGLALDIATLVQELSKPKGGTLMVGAGLLSGSLNFLLIVWGGQAVFGGTSNEQLGASRRPNPPSPFSS
jgi:hypothetical protein